MDYDFELFWRSYPSRGGGNANPKQPARVIWDRLVKRDELPPMAEMITLTQRFCKQCVSNKSYGTPYVPHARTWLSQMRWEGNEGPVPAPTLTVNPSVLPLGYEDVARKLIESIGQAKYMAWFGQAQWSNGGDTIRIKVLSNYERNTIEQQYKADLERLTGKTIEVGT